MKDERKTKLQLISELNGLRRKLDSPTSKVADDRQNTGRRLNHQTTDSKFSSTNDQDALVVIDAQSGNIIDVNQVDAG